LRRSSKENGLRMLRLNQNDATAAPCGARIRVQIGLREHDEEDPPTTRIPAMRIRSEGRMEGERRNSMRKHVTAWDFSDSPGGGGDWVVCETLPRGTEKYYFVATNINLPYWQEAQADFWMRPETLE